MKHLTIHDRKVIEQGIRSNTSFRQIALTLGKHPSTISREVKSRRTLSNTKPYGRTKNSCLHRYDCQMKDLCNRCSFGGLKKCSACEHCNDHCPHYQEDRCKKLLKPPYVCNACTTRSTCSLNVVYYKAHVADDLYHKQLQEIRSGFCLNGQEFHLIDQLVSPRIRQGQSIYAILQDIADELPCGESTIYRLVAAGELSVQNIHLPRKVRFKVRSVKKHHKVDRKAGDGRRYDDFLAFIEQGDHGPMVEMDSIEGKRGGAVLLSLRWPDLGLHLLFWRPANTARSVQLIFDELYRILGHERFIRIFGVILADNGSEFSNPKSIEFAADGARRTHVFFCKPSAPYQKPSVERGHAEVRRVLPKGTSFDDLSAEQVRRIQDHLNSYPIKKLNGSFPYDTFSKLFDDSYAKALGWTVINPKSIRLTPELIID